MVLSCSDSRVNISSIFNEVEGKFFTHRNIANIVPAYERKKINNCTGSVLEYAVNTLYVKNIIILGHSNCGGVKAFYDNKKKKNNKNNDFINEWLKNLDPIYTNKTKVTFSDLEQSAIKLSIKNLLTYPFVRKNVKHNKLTITGLWYDIKLGIIYSYNEKKDKFEEIK